MKMKEENACVGLATKGIMNLNGYKGIFPKRKRALWV